MKYTFKELWQGLILRVILLIFGFCLLAFGINLLRMAGLGFGPWEVFHSGLGFTLNMPMGRASIIVSMVIIVISLFFKTKITWATFANTFCIGYFVDFFAPFMTWMPTIFWQQRFLAVFATAIMGLGIGVYINMGFGAGARDGLTLSLHRITNLKVRTIRTLMEIFALIVGYFLGGPVGLGTIIFGFGIGPLMEISLKWTQYPYEKGLPKKASSVTEEAPIVEENPTTVEDAPMAL